MLDQDKADRAIRFVKNLRHTKGEWAGHLFNLMEWEEKIIRDLFGTVNEDGTRQYREAYISTARKNGKTELAAAVANICLYADAENGAEIYCNAGDRDQASIVFDAARVMVEQSNVLQKHSKVLTAHKRIVYFQRQSFLRALSHEAQTKHGFNVHCAINDEVHVWPNRDLYTVMKTGTGARTQPLIVNITTAGWDRNSLCWELYDYAKKVLAGIIIDPTFYVAIFELDKEDDWKSETNWYKANPGLGIYRSLNEMRDSFQRALDVPVFENEFKRLYLNLWTEQYERFIPMDKYDACDETFDLKTLAGKQCFAGLDLASSIDIAAFVVAFPDEDGFVDILPFFYVPDEAIKKRSERDRVPYDLWQRQGFIKATPGNVIDYAFIEEDIKRVAETYELKGVVYDRWGAVQIAQRLTDIGIKVIPMGQGFASMSAPTKEFLNLILKRKIRCNANPVLRWMASNTASRQDPAGNVKPDRSRSSEKIDGIVATIMAIDQIIRSGTGISIYEQRGIFMIDAEEVKEEAVPEEEKEKEETELREIIGDKTTCLRCGFPVPIATGICPQCGKVAQK